LPIIFEGRTQNLPKILVKGLDVSHDGFSLTVFLKGENPMKQIYVIKETKKLREILNESYGYFLAALKAKNPKAESLIEDKWLAQAQDAYALIRLGQIKIGQMENEEGRFVTLEIK
jgi:hypothetical protein